MFYNTGSDRVLKEEAYKDNDGDKTKADEHEDVGVVAEPMFVSAILTLDLPVTSHRHSHHPGIKRTRANDCGRGFNQLGSGESVQTIVGQELLVLSVITVLMTIADKVRMETVKSLVNVALKTVIRIGAGAAVVAASDTRSLTFVRVKDFLLLLDL